MIPLRTWDYFNNFAFCYQKTSLPADSIFQQVTVRKTQSRRGQPLRVHNGNLPVAISTTQEDREWEKPYENGTCNPKMRDYAYALGKSVAIGDYSAIPYPEA